MSMTISRPDITSTEITEYPVETRFLKLPLVPYLKLVPAPMGEGSVFDNLNGPQIALLNAINSPNYRFIVACLSRRLGKTFIANIAAQLLALMPGKTILVVAPNYALSSISFSLQRQLLKTFDLQIDRVSEKDRILDMSNGSSIRIASTAMINSALGRSYDLVLWDEAAIDEDNKAAYEQQIRPTLDRPGSKSVWISTPRGMNYFKEFYERGFDNRYKQWFSIWADYHENSRMTEDDVAEAKATMSSQMFDQEYRALFTSYEGKVYEFDSEKCVQVYEREDADEFIWGLDPGFRDPTGLIVLAYRDRDNTYHVVEEYLATQSSTELHVEAWTAWNEKYPPVALFIDAAAAQFANDLAYTYNISTTPAKKDVLAGIASVQTVVEQDRLFVAPHCVNTLQMLENFSWKEKVRNNVLERTKHDKHSHLADALRYAVYTLTVGG